jgi:hypothetical protein
MRKQREFICTAANPPTPEQAVAMFIASAPAWARLLEAWRRERDATGIRVGDGCGGGDGDAVERSASREQTAA